MSSPIFPPKFLAGFPNAYPTKRKTAFAGGLRHRWKDGRGLIYEWDYQHGHVEVYDHRGVHQGAFAADDGRFVSGADRTRRVEP